jgi:hypothetical protein
MKGWEAAKQVVNDIAPIRGYARADVGAYINAAGRKGSHERAALINEVAKAAGVTRRTVERWSTPDATQTRGVSAKLGKVLGDVIKPLRTIPAGARVTFYGTVKVSGDERYRGKPNGVEVVFNSDELRDFVSKADEFEEGVTEAFDSDGLPNDPGDYLLHVYGSSGYFSKDDVTMS